MTATLARLLPTINDPFRVTVPGGRQPFVMAYTTDKSLPAAFVARVLEAEDKVITRLAGGVKGLPPEAEVEFVLYVEALMRGYRGVIFSGATREIRDGRTRPTITDAAVAVKNANPGTILLGSFPRTRGTFGLVEQSRLVVGEHDTAPNPDYDGFCLLQNGPEGELDWAGDLPFYFRMMDDAEVVYGFRRGGVIAGNGGAVTEKEILRSAKENRPTILIRGFAGKADEYAAQLTGTRRPRWVSKDHNTVVVDRGDPEAGRDVLIDLGLIRAA